MKRRYGIAISAMILAVQFAGPVGATEPSVDQLEEIATLLDANDVGGMREFLELHPELLEGETELAALLRQYMEESDNPIAFIGVSRGRWNGSDGDDLDADRRASLPDAAGQVATSDAESPAAEAEDPDVALY